MTTPRTPRRRDAERTTHDLLDAAEREFAEHGFAGARVDRIAAAAGCNKALIFQRFGDKEGLYRAVFDAALTRWMPSPDEAAAQLRAGSRAEFIASVRGLVARSIEFLNAEPRTARIALWEIAGDWSILTERRHPSECGDGFSEVLRTFLTQAAESGFLRPDLPVEAQIGLVGQIPLVLRAMRFDLTDPALAAFITDFIVAGLVVPDQTEGTSWSI